MTNEINFIREIEKRECLYNHNLPEYNSRDASEQAWAEVARNRNLTVNESKEKWRNIRSSLQRSMKKTDKLKKKPYYLSPYLQFVLPYMKLSQESSEEQQRDECQMLQENELEIQMGSVKFELDPEGGQNPFESVEIFQPDMLIENTSTRHSTSPDDSGSPVHRRRRQHIVSRNHESKRINLKRKPSSYTTNSQPNKCSRLNYSSMRYFLLSLLPDFETMKEDQIRMFKIKVMMLIDDIKSNISEVRQISKPSNDTERLQKRLINLLLRNLKRN